jgi:hypothetical protein
MNNVLYLIGSLRNSRIPELAKRLRSENENVEVFDDWYAAGPEADDFWKEYEQSKGSDYQEALRGYSARNVFEYDRRHLNRCTHAILVLPAGKSGHMEIMYAQYAVGAKTAILLDPEDVRWDVMYQFIPTILNNDEEINSWLNTPNSQEQNTTPINPGWNYCPNLRSKELQGFSVLEPRSMTTTTGEAELNTLVLSERL